MDVDYLGAEGGRLAMAFAAGCLAAFSFLSMVGGFLWKFVGHVRADRIAELEDAREKEREECREDIQRLRDRIQALETINLYERTGRVAHDAQAAISEIHAQIRELKEKA